MRFIFSHPDILPKVSNKKAFPPQNAPSHVNGNATCLNNENHSEHGLKG